MSTHENDYEKAQDTILEELENDDCCCLLPWLDKASQSTQIWRGLIFIIFGALMVARPLSAFAIIVMILGLYVAIEAIIILALAFRVPDNLRIMLLINAIIMLILGISATIFPWMMGEYAVIFMGAWLLVSGIQNMLLIKSSHRRWRCFFAGLIAIVSGVFFIFAPFMGIAALSWIFSILFFVSGAMMLASGLNSKCCNN